jgi:hypothetical protein
MAKRNRLDHLLPQGYLEGFTAPSTPGQLSVFDCRDQRWFETGTAVVGAVRGFYDYTEGTEPGQDADEAFANLETRFPAVRRDLFAGGVSDRRKHLDVLLAFAQMLRVRSELFRDQNMANDRRKPFMRIKEILPAEPSKTDPGTFVTPIRVEPYRPDNDKEHELLLRNKAITDMRTEIAKGPTWMSDMHWCLRSCQNPADPFVTSDNAVVVQRCTPALEEALRDRETLIFFPICWQACLVGSPAKLDVETGALDPSDIRKVRGIFRQSAFRFVFSPLRVDLAGK